MRGRRSRSRRRHDRHFMRLGSQAMVSSFDLDRVFALLNMIALLLLLAPAVSRFHISGKWGRRLQFAGILTLGTATLGAALATAWWYLK
jgi:hypothetical protein